MTGLAQVLFPWRANGSLVTDEKGQVVGSALIAQGFANPAYFQPRPSAAGEKGYDATSSSGSNLGPTSKKLQDRINDDLKRLKAENPDAAGPVPAELVTASASGLDPHLSPDAMLWQLPRVAKHAGLPQIGSRPWSILIWRAEPSASWVSPGSTYCSSTWRSIGNLAARLRFLLHLRKRRKPRKSPRRARLPRSRRSRPLRLRRSKLSVGAVDEKGRSDL